jgi:hypothetical protein
LNTVDALAGTLRHAEASAKVSSLSFVGITFLNSFTLLSDSEIEIPSSNVIFLNEPQPGRWFWQR